MCMRISVENLFYVKNFNVLFKIMNFYLYSCNGSCVSEIIMKIVIREGLKVGNLRV